MTASQPSLLVRMGQQYGVDPNKMMVTLKSTAFRRAGQITNEEMMSLLVVAEQYGLNPFTGEIHAFPSRSGIIPVVGVDGWSRIINENPNFDGVEFVYSEEMAQPEGGKRAPEWIEAVIYRKDRSHPTRVREYLDEVYRGTQPWVTHTKRMLRHKALIQGARIAFGFAGLYDEDEAERIREAQVVEPQGGPVESTPTSRTQDLKDQFLPPSDPDEDGAEAEGEELAAEGPEENPDDELSALDGDPGQTTKEDAEDGE